MITEPWSDELTEGILAGFPTKNIEFAQYRGQRFLALPAGLTVPVLETLKHDFQFNYLVDVTAVDYPNRAERFDLIYIVYSFARNLRIRLKTRLPDRTPALSATRVHPTANWLEREVYDMFGIEFAGHPNLKRILLPEEWTGFPLRKDYSIIQQDTGWVQKNLGIESGQ